MTKNQLMTGQKEGEGVIQIRLRWQDTSDLPTLYANQVYITHSGGEFYVVFGEIQLPLLIDPTPEELEDLKELKVKPVAKLVLTPDGMSSIAKAMSDNLHRYLRRQEQGKGEKDS